MTYVMKKLSTTLCFLILLSKSREANSHCRTDLQTARDTGPHKEEQPLVDPRVSKDTPFFFFTTRMQLPCDGRRTYTQRPGDDPWEAAWQVRTLSSKRRSTLKVLLFDTQS
jgi:hypothetical protein